MRPLDDEGRAAQPRGEDRHLLLEQHLQLVARALQQFAPALPGALRLGDAEILLEILDEVAVALRDHRFQVLELPLDERRRDQQIDPERLAADALADPANVGPQLVDLHAAAAQDADAARVADRDDHVAGMREGHDRHLAAVFLAERVWRGSPFIVFPRIVAPARLFAGEA